MCIKMCQVEHQILSNTAFQGVFSQESDALFVGLGHIPDSCASNTPILTGQISVGQKNLDKTSR